MFVNQKWIENGTIYKPQGNFVYNRYVHFYSVDTIPSYPVRSLRLSVLYNKMSLRIYRKVYSLFCPWVLLHKARLWTLLQLARNTKAWFHYEQRHFLLESDRKTVRSCLLTARQHSGPIVRRNMAPEQCIVLWNRACPKSQIIGSWSATFKSQKPIKWRPVRNVLIIRCIRVLHLMKDNKVQYKILFPILNMSETLKVVSFISNKSHGITERSDIDNKH
jgi:hypothetical protein